MDKNVKMKSGLLIAAILASFLSANAGWALDGKVFPGKGDKQTWIRGCKFLDQGVELSKTNQEAALAKFQKAIEIYPYADCFYRNLGVSYENQKQPQLGKAEAAYKKAIGFDEKDWRNWSGLASALGKQERYRECRNAGAKALQCNPPQDRAAKIRADIAGIDSYLAKNK